VLPSGLHGENGQLAEAAQKLYEVAAQPSAPDARAEALTGMVALWLANLSPGGASSAIGGAGEQGGMTADAIRDMTRREALVRSRPQS
jgi:hypothetical protein